MGPLSARCLLRPKRNVSCLITGSLPARRYASFNAEAHSGPRLHDPTPSELLRATLTGSTRTVADNETILSSHKYALELLDREWTAGSPPPALWCALKGVYPMSRTKDKERLPHVADLSTLRNVAENLAVDDTGAVKLQGKRCKNLGGALERCEQHNTYAEILAFLSDLITRLQRLKLPVQPQLLELGLYYAALNLSASALGTFLQRYKEVISSQGTPGVGEPILHTLLEALESALFENPRYNTSLLLVELTGEGEAARQGQFTLHEMLLGVPDQDRQNWSTYLCILAKLQSHKTLRTLWKGYLKVLDTEDESACHSAYEVVLALIQAEQSDTAARFLEDISQQSNDTLPYITTLPNLQQLVDDRIVGEALPDLVGDGDYEKLLESRLENIEQRLGIEWKNAQGQVTQRAHVGVASNPFWAVFTDQPLLTMDGDSAGYDDPARLYPELQAHGCSKSLDDLGQLVNLLNEQDGNTQELVTHLDRNQRRWMQTNYGSLALRWCPEHSPIEFSDSPLPAFSSQPQEWTPSSLGLIRARAMSGGVPQAGIQCLHLLQLGRMDVRRSPTEPWQPSGYIVAWDRHRGETIALSVGKNYGVVDPGPTPPGAPFGALMLVRPSTAPNAPPLSPNRRPRDLVGPYYLDLDPATDLGFR